MSATNRGQVREKLDQYSTPPWCVQALLNGKVKLPFDSELLWLEPCAGEGAIIKAMPDAILWDAIEIDPKYGAGLCATYNVSSIWLADYFNVDPQKRYACVLTNPPYSCAFEFVQKSMLLSDHVVMLLRVNWLGSIDRSEFLRATKPDVHVLAPRPRFTGKGSDSTEYAWFHFYPGSTGKWSVLPTGPTKKTPKEFTLYGEHQRLA